MRFAMPNPARNPKTGTYYLRVHVPKNVAKQARNTFLSLPIGETPVTVKVTSHVKASLRTKDAAEAKQRFIPAHAVVEQYWQSLRDGPRRLSHRDALALAGEVRAVFISACDEDPGATKMWERVREADKVAQSGQSNPLAVPTSETVRTDLEGRFGGLVDAVLRKHMLQIDDGSRERLLGKVADAMQEAVSVNLAKAQGDYSNSGATNKYPELSPKRKRVEAPQAKADTLTFSAVIDRKVAESATGKDARPLPKSTERKYRLAVKEFVEHRCSDNLLTVTAKEADAWQRSMLEAEESSNATIKQRLQNLKTVIQWAREAGLGDVFPDSHPLQLVKSPTRTLFKDGKRTLKDDEAKAILLAARQQCKPELRWCPWMMAYSGARGGELAQLRPDDFFEVNGDWFYRISTKGGRSAKNQSSVRRIPVHPDLVAEGLIEFVQQPEIPQDQRIFPLRTQMNLRDWIRNDLGLIRDDLAPNHGWRHLFEDVALVAGMLETAKNHITGRRTGRSEEGYGKSDAMLPGLAREMRKIPSFL